MILLSSVLLIGTWGSTFQTLKCNTVKHIEDVDSQFLVNDSDIETQYPEPPSESPLLQQESPILLLIESEHQELDELLQKSPEGKAISQKNILDSKSRKQLIHIVGTQIIGPNPTSDAISYSNKSEVSAQEACMHILGLSMAEASVAEVYINTSPPDVRVRLQKPAAQLARLLEENPDSSDVFASGLLEHYEQRPNCLEGCCLADFAALYTFHAKKRGKQVRAEL
ncbi:hypothetical protein M8J77_023325 [Diaphorina citri]|nr:hypothetical protein M8J77_023325 [Diaphorina citri]